MISASSVLIVDADVDDNSVAFTCELESEDDCERLEYRLPLTEEPGDALNQLVRLCRVRGVDIIHDADMYLQAEQAECLGD